MVLTNQNTQIIDIQVVIWVVTPCSGTCYTIIWHLNPEESLYPTTLLHDVTTQKTMT